MTYSFLGRKFLWPRSARIKVRLFKNHVQHVLTYQTYSTSPGYSDQREVYTQRCPYSWAIWLTLGMATRPKLKKNNIALHIWLIKNHVQHVLTYQTYSTSPGYSDQREVYTQRCPYSWAIWLTLGMATRPKLKKNNIALHIWLIIFLAAQTCC